MSSLNIQGCVDWTTKKVKFYTAGDAYGCLGDWLEGCMIWEGVHAGQVKVKITNAETDQCNDTFYGCVDWEDDGVFWLALPFCCVPCSEVCPDLVAPVVELSGFEACTIEGWKQDCFTKEGCGCTHTDVPIAGSSYNLFLNGNSIDGYYPLDWYGKDYDPNSKIWSCIWGTVAEFDFGYYEYYESNPYCEGEPTSIWPMDLFNLILVTMKDVTNTYVTDLWGQMSFSSIWWQPEGPPYTEFWWWPDVLSCEKIGSSCCGNEYDERCEVCIYDWLYGQGEESGFNVTDRGEE